ncbi:MAG: hexameric tyrosine-coordinated heme protein [Balneolaceae bacterium]|nr:hexameric tyrosine-coordinated heme protein [Balneolaceae bacterium]
MTKRTYIYLIVILVFTVLAAVGIKAMTTDQAEPGSSNDSMSLITETPEEGFQVAISLARKGVTETQSDREVLFELREIYTRDPDALIASSHVIAVHFQTVAAANNYWKGK